MAGDKRKVQEVNAGSMADIAFLLLIFFLVATTMNVDTGIHRTLPPINKDENQDIPEVKERNMLKINVNYANIIQIGTQIVDITQVKDKTKEFILNPYDDPNLPEKKIVDIELLGEFPVSEGVISLQSARTTSYDTYIHVQNELTRVFNEIRDDLASSRFGAKFNDLSEAQSNAIREAVPVNISEANPKDIGER